MSHPEHDNFAITDRTHIRNFYKAVIDQGLMPTPETLVAVGRDEMLRLAPSRPDGGRAIDVEGIALFFDEDDRTSALPATIRVTVKLEYPPTLRVKVSPQLANQWDTARVGNLLEQILDQLKIGNKSVLRTDVLEPITKLAVNGITADARALADLKDENVRLTTANTILEAENGRLLTEKNASNVILDQRLREIRELKAQLREKDQPLFAIPEDCTVGTHEAFAELERIDRTTARRVALAVIHQYRAYFPETLPSHYDVSYEMFKEVPVHVRSYLKQLCAALLFAPKVINKVEYQMVKAMLNEAMQTERQAALRIKEAYLEGRRLEELEPEFFEDIYKALRNVANMEKQ